MDHKPVYVFQNLIKIAVQPTMPYVRWIDQPSLDIPSLAPNEPLCRVTGTVHEGKIHTHRIMKDGVLNELHYAGEEKQLDLLHEFLNQHTMHLVEENQRLRETVHQLQWWPGPSMVHLDVVRMALHGSMRTLADSSIPLSPHQYMAAVQIGGMDSRMIINQLCQEANISQLDPIIVFTAHTAPDACQLFPELSQIAVKPNRGANTVSPYNWNMGRSVVVSIPDYTTKYGYAQSLDLPLEGGGPAHVIIDGVSFEGEPHSFITRMINTIRPDKILSATIIG